jgi:hypothetical protein
MAALSIKDSNSARWAIPARRKATEEIAHELKEDR